MGRVLADRKRCRISFDTKIFKDGGLTQTSPPASQAMTVERLVFAYHFSSCGLDKLIGILLSVRLSVPDRVVSTAGNRRTYRS
jgi:hypothetical protein